MSEIYLFWCILSCFTEAKLFADQDYGDKVIKADELVIFSGTDVPKMKQLSLTSHDKDDEDLFA